RCAGEYAGKEHGYQQQSFQSGHARRFFFFKQKTAYELGLGIPAEPLFRSLFLLVLILLLMPTLNFLPVWFALSLLRFRLPSRLPMMFILWMVAMMVVIIPSRTV